MNRILNRWPSERITEQVDTEQGPVLKETRCLTTTKNHIESQLKNRGATISYRPPFFGLWKNFAVIRLLKTRPSSERTWEKSYGGFRGKTWNGEFLLHCKWCLCVCVMIERWNVNMQLRKCVITFNWKNGDIWRHRA